jgi:biotin carboxyl carrier protein
MQKTFRITVEGRSYNVLVEDLTDQVQHPVALPTAPGDGAAVTRPPVAATPAAPAAAPAAAAEAVPAGPGAVVAPLAGVVYAIDVRVGQTVKPGDQVATIEAMKMKTYVLAKTGGTVGSIAVKVQDSVETGQVLLTLA